MSSKQYTVAVIGGGIIGCATAMVLSRRMKISLVLLEAESELAAHQTGNNSGVIHSGLYYSPGSMKAKNCVTGRAALYNFCEHHNLPVERCGKLVVASGVEEVARLDDLEIRGNANGLKGLRRLKADELKQ